MATTNVPIVLSEQRAAGIAAELTRFNAANPDGQLTLPQFVQALVDSRADAAVREHSVITPSGFILRFTGKEYSDITAAAKVNKDVAALLEKLKAASEVDLTHEVVIDGLASLEGAGLIAAGRAAEIGALK
jgi:hypothetical protein